MPSVELPKNWDFEVIRTPSSESSKIAIWRKIDPEGSRMEVEGEYEGVTVNELFDTVAELAAYLNKHQGYDKELNEKRFYKN